MPKNTVSMEVIGAYSSMGGRDAVDMAVLSSLVAVFRCLSEFASSRTNGVRVGMKR